MAKHLATCSGTDLEEEPSGEELDRFLAVPLGAARVPVTPIRIDGVRIGTLVGFADGGATPLVTYPDQPMSAAQRARATLDLHGAHIGRSAVLMFEDGDPRLPIVVGCLQDAGADGLPNTPDHVDVEADGKRLVISAQDQIVMRCGKASITLTKEGKVIVQGAYLSNHSSGVLRLKGGSVQIN